jgi:hypothetical protein
MLELFQRIGFDLAGELRCLRQRSSPISVPAHAQIVHAQNPRARQHPTSR